MNKYKKTVTLYLTVLPALGRSLLTPAPA